MSTIVFGMGKGIILTFDDFGIAELRLLNKKVLVKERHKKVCIP